jgi:hypothetical protein
VSVTDPLYVVALNYRQFLDWCARKGHNPNQRPATVVYVRDATRLMGLRDVRLVFVPNWMDRKDWREIYNRALIVGRRPS